MIFYASMMILKSFHPILNLFKKVEEILFFIFFQDHTNLLFRVVKNSHNDSNNFFNFRSQINFNNQFFKGLSDHHYSLIFLPIE